MHPHRSKKPAEATYTGRPTPAGSAARPKPRPTAVADSMPPPQKTGPAITAHQNPKAGKPRSLLSTLLDAKGAGPEVGVAVPTSGISKPQTSGMTEAAVRTSTLQYTFHDRVREFLSGDGYALIRDSVNSELRGLVKKLALNMAEDMDLGENSASRAASKYKSASVIWKEQQASPPPNANKSIQLFLACIMP